MGSLVPPSASVKPVCLSVSYGQLFVMYLKHHSRTANSPSAEVVLYHLTRYTHIQRHTHYSVWWVASVRLIRLFPLSDHNNIVLNSKVDLFRSGTVLVSEREHDSLSCVFREGVCKKSHILKLNMTGKFALNIVDNLVVVHHQSSQVRSCVCACACRWCIFLTKHLVKIVDIEETLLFEKMM